MQHFSVACYQLRGLLSALDALELDAQALTRAAEIDTAGLHDIDSRFPESTLLRLWCAAEQRWQGPLLGLRAGACVPFGSFELFDYLVGSSASAGDAFTRLARYARLCASGLSYEIVPDCQDDRAGFSLSMEHPLALELWPAGIVEYLWTLLIARMRARFGTKFRSTLQLQHAPRGPGELYRSVLGEVRFQCARSALFVPAEVWQLENPQADPGLERVLVRYADEVLARLPGRDDPLDPLRRALAEALRAGDASIESMARRVAVTPRTLQRRLAAAGCTFKELLDDVRRELARSYLEHTVLSLTEITYLLDYSDPSAFNRAFRRWTGQTPAEYRFALRGDARRTRFSWS